MLDKVLRRFKYLQVLLEEHAVKVLKFLKAFTEEQRVALAKVRFCLLPCEESFSTSQAHLN